MKQKRMFVALLIGMLVPLGLLGSPEEKVSVEKNYDHVAVSIEVGSNISPNMRYLSKEGCWKMDLIGEIINCRSDPFAFSQGPLKLLSCQTLSKLPPIQRFSFYVRDAVEMKMKREDEKIVLYFRFSSDLIGKTEDPDGRSPQPLLVPVVEREEVVIELNNTSAFSILKELAKRANLNVKFRDPPLKKVSVKTRGETPKAALEKVCRSIGMLLTHETDGWWISAEDNPLLEFSGEESTDFSAISEMTNREALKRICSGNSANRILEKLPNEVLDRPVIPICRPVSPRLWISSLLKSHGLDERVVLAK